MNIYTKHFLLTEAVHLSPQEYFNFLKKNLVAQQLLKVVRKCPALSHPDLVVLSSCGLLVLKSILNKILRQTQKI